MASFWHKSVRCVTLGLMILLTGIAPLLTISIDNDDDDDTPPMTVEMNVVAPARKAVHLPTAEASAQPFAGSPNSETFAKASLASQHHPTLEATMVSPQLVVPLRT
jgi:hypothetical protein